MSTSKFIWWKRGIVYQIYSRSFQDSNADGVGDLKGIIGRLEYLTWLGVDAIWISPIYPSPMADFGYDVSDYCGIDLLFGTLADFDALVRKAHESGLKVILDFVPNHSSDHHAWFQQSRADTINSKRDWYIWRDPSPSGDPPNNWRSQFGGPAWTFDAVRGQYYLHSFLREQPDLNWRHPALREAMLDAMRFWLDRGVDGFRIDVIWLLIKDKLFRDNPPNPGWAPGQAEIGRFLPLYNADQPEVHEIIAEMRTLLDQYEERVLIGEIYLPLDRLVTYYGKDLAGAHLPFNFQLIMSAWNAPAVARLIEEYESALPQGGWPNWVLSNHDQPRIAARIGSDQARVAAMLLLTLRGTPTMYYGDELGLGRVPIPADAIQDPWERNEPGLGLGRDPSRTPMQWDAGANAGFTNALQPWLPIDVSYRDFNVETLKADTRSLLNLYRKLIELRRGWKALSVGAFRLLKSDKNLLVYERTFQDQRLIIALNFSSNPQPLPQEARYSSVLLSTYMDNQEAIRQSVLRADEGVVISPAKQEKS